MQSMVRIKAARVKRRGIKPERRMVLVWTALQWLKLGKWMMERREILECKCVGERTMICQMIVCSGWTVGFV